MKKAIYIVLAVVIAAVILTSLLLFQPPQQPPQNGTYTYSFEDGFEGWAAGADIPEDPNRPGELVDWSIELAGNVSFSGAKSALLYINGLQDDGTIWIERKLPVAPNSVRNVDVSFQFWSETESFNTLAVVVGYIGDKNPQVEEDFQVLGAANEVEGWKTYSISTQVQSGSSGEVYVALGISVRWEAHMTYFLDDVTITIS